MNNHKKPIKYFIYARKSTESDDKQMASINDQITEVKRIAKQLNLEVVDIISEAKSAKSPGRKKFNEMLSRIKNGEAEGILCWKLNRLARNPIDGGDIIWNLQKGVIKHIQTHGRDYKPSDNVIMMYIEFGMSNQYSNDLSVDVKRGMRQKAARGWYPCAVLPIGYIHNKGKQDEVIPDPKRFSLIERLWRLFLTEQYSISDLKREATKMGLLNNRGNPYALNTFFKLFQNEFYAGYFHWRDDDGVLTQRVGKHQKMISHIEFKKGQTILKEKGRPTRVNTLSFPYRGALSCGECGCAITAEHKLQIRCSGCNTKFSFKNRSSCPNCGLQIKKMKDATITDKTYYRCTKKKKRCHQRYVEQSKLTQIISDKLEEITIDIDFFNLAISCLEEFEQEDGATTQKLKRNLLKRKTELISMRQQLITLRLNGEITSEEMTDAKNQINTELEDLQIKIEELEINSFSWSKILKEKINFSLDASTKFKNGDDLKKKEMLSKLGSNLTLLDKSLYFTKDFKSELLYEWYRLYYCKKTGFEPDKSLILKDDFVDLSNFEAVTSSVLSLFKFGRTQELSFVA